METVRLESQAMNETQQVTDTSAPVFGSWKRWYVAVLLTLALSIVGLFALSWVSL